MANKVNESLYSLEDIETVERMITVGATTELVCDYARQIILEHPTATAYNRRRASHNLRDCVTMYDILKLMIRTRNKFYHIKEAK